MSLLWELKRGDTVTNGKSKQQYTLGEYKGSGFRSKVYQLLGSNSSDGSKTEKEEFAGKLINKNKVIKQVDKSNLENEIEIHSSVSHPNIVQLISHFDHL